MTGGELLAPSADCGRSRRCPEADAGRVARSSYDTELVLLGRRGILPGRFIPDIFIGKGMRVAELGLDPRIVEILKAQGIEELYPPQADAIGPALFADNFAPPFPTPTGKPPVASPRTLPAVLPAGRPLYFRPR